MIKKTLSTKADINGYSQVLFLIHEGRNFRVRVKSGVYVPKMYWNDKKESLVIPKKINATQIMELQQLRDNLSDVEKNVTRLIEIYGKENVTKQFIETTLPILKGLKGTLTRGILDDLVSTVDDTKEQDKQILNIYELAKEFCNKGISQARIRLYHVVFRCMSRYEVYRNQIVEKKFSWDIESTKREDIKDFFDYLANEHLYRVKFAKIFDKARLEFVDYDKKPKHRKEQIEERGENRLICMRKATKAFWNWMIKNQYTTNNPFVGVEIGVERYGTPFYLTVEERNQIANTNLSANKALETQRDIFVFQCQVGCRVGDLMSFTTDNIVNDMLIYTPHKTKDESNSITARVPLTKQALALIKKYKGTKKRKKLFPFISEQNYNEYIKKIIKECGIDRKVSVRNPKTGENEMKPIYEVASSHMARRTFVGNAYKAVKDPNLVGRMSGHVEGSKAFVRYRDIDDDMLKDVINAIQ